MTRAGDGLWYNVEWTRVMTRKLMTRSLYIQVTSALRDRLYVSFNLYKPTWLNCHVFQNKSRHLASSLRAGAGTRSRMQTEFAGYRTPQIQSATSPHGHLSTVYSLWARAPPFSLIQLLASWLTWNLILSKFRRLKYRKRNLYFRSLKTEICLVIFHI